MIYRVTSEHPMILFETPDWVERNPFDLILAQAIGE
jgi:hypothetical protein